MFGMKCFNPLEHDCVSCSHSSCTAEKFGVGASILQLSEFRYVRLYNGCIFYLLN